MSNTEYVQIKDLKPGMKNINAVFIVLEVGPLTLTKESREVRTLRVADATAAVNLSVWDEAGSLLLPGDIVRLLRGYASLWRGVLTLYSGKSGDIQKIDEFCMVFNEQVNMSDTVSCGVGAGAGAVVGVGAPAPPAVHVKNERFAPPPAASDAAPAKLAPHKGYVRARPAPRPSPSATPRR